MKSERTICFTDYFCNKLFCRSLTNNKFNKLCRRHVTSLDIVHLVLKEGMANQDFEQDLDFKESGERERFLTTAWSICTELKKNFMDYSHDDFRSFFQQLKPSEGDRHIEADKIAKVMINILEKLIPRKFYGCTKNRKAFFDFIRYVLRGMAGQHIILSRLLHKWDLDNIPWLNRIKDVGIKQMILTKFIIYIIKNTVCSILAVVFYVTTTNITHETRKLYFYLKSHWQKFSNRYISYLIRNGDLVKCSASSIGRKMKKNLPLNVRQTRRATLKTIPVMRLIIKSNNSIRTIIKYKKKNAADKKLDITRRNLFRTINTNRTERFEIKYVGLHEKWIRLNKPKLYFVKTDLKDAFGSVDVNLLRTILIRLHHDYQERTISVERKRLVYQEIRKLINDLNNPILVRYGSCVYEWKRGLVQGMRYSPILSDIYYNDFDSKYLTDYYKESSNINFLVRYVDDYLFVTDDMNRAISFLSIMTTSGRVNTSKTLVNFNSDISNYEENINFFGYVINTDTLEITRDETVYSGQICYRIAFNKSISNRLKFLLQRITQTTVPLSGLFFNLKINSEKIVWKNIFISFCISANKFCLIVSHLYCDNDFNPIELLEVYKRKVVVKMSDHIIRLIKENKSKDIVYPYCINHFRYLAYKALSLFACKTRLCMKLYPLIEECMKKSNCMTGTWKPHYRNYNYHGIAINAAIREICRRLSTRRCIEGFVRIPAGFEAYVR